MSQLFAWGLELLGGSQAPRRAVCGTRGSLRTMHGGGSAPSCCACVAIGCRYSQLVVLLSKVAFDDYIRTIAKGNAAVHDMLCIAFDKSTKICPVNESNLSRIGDLQHLVYCGKRIITPFSAS